MKEKADSEGGLRKWIPKALQIIVGVTLLTLIVTRVDWADFLETIRGASIVWVAAVAGVNLADRMFMAAKWKYLLEQALGVDTYFRTLIAHYFRGGLVGKAVQWDIGGDIARAVGAGKDTGEADLVVLSVILEKIVGFAALGVLASLAVLFLNARVSLAEWELLIPAAVAACASLIGLPFLLVREKTTGWIADLIRYVPLESLRKRLIDLLGHRQHWRGQTGALTVFFLLTILEQLVSTINLLLLSEAFGLSVTVVGAFAVMPIVSFGSRLPLSIESLGVREGLYVVMLGVLGIAAAEAFAVALTVRILDIVVIGGGALLTSPLQTDTDRLQARAN